MVLSPEQFTRLREYASYSTHKLVDMLSEFQPDGMFFKYLSDDLQTIDFNGFTHFVNVYFGAELPADLIQGLFFSFAQSTPDNQTEQTDESTEPETRVDNRRPSTSALEGAINTVKQAFSGVANSNKDTIAATPPTSQRNRKISKGNHFSASAAISRRFLKNNSKHNGNPGSSKTTANMSQQSGPSMSTINEDLNPDPTKRIPLKPLVCYLSLLEGAPPEDKLEFVFHVYDSDDNGYLDNKEMESIIEQMMNVARYQQWDTIELEPILRQMMAEIDYDNDGIVSLEEWKRGGLTTIPLLVLLGFDTEMKEDGVHIWRLRHFSKPTYCNVCLNVLIALHSMSFFQGLACSLCKYTVHERCVRSAENSCIHTYNSNPSKEQVMLHHWIDSNSASKCVKCKSTVIIFQGKRCRWCKNLLHNKCISQWPKECDLGSMAYHILPPTNIVPAFLDRSQQQSHGNLLQLTPLRGNRRPLLVLINPKSGGRQGERIYRKLQYLLNPRQVYDLCKDGPEPGLNLFKSIKNVNILVCGGDGTIGWVLDAMDRIDYDENQRPPVGILPLGTGNDLARCLKWGGGYENEPLQKILQSIEKSSQGDPQPYHIINNYFSIGVDASIAHRFHVMRERFPEKFNSRMRNKLWYFELGTSETISSTCKKLHEQVDILCDGETIDLGNGPNLEGIALLNIGSIYGGSNLWGSSRKGSTWHIPIIFPPIANSSTQLQSRVQDIGDRLIEVVGLESAIQMGQIKAGVRSAARRLSQCSTIVIHSYLITVFAFKTHKTFPMQIDGEPWMQPPCIIQIIHKNSVPMLIGTNGNRKRTVWNPLRRQPTDDT
ncbi:Diacylglycerol kinase [Aphelenchoides besseyi]|nr:Diacylglycerol kinase [Aphelenchoides besseyi]